MASSTKKTREDAEAPVATTVNIGGRERKLHYDLNALCEIEERLGLKGLQEIANQLEKLEGRSLRCVLWAGLIHDDPDLKETEVGRWDLAVNDVLPVAVGALRRLIRG